MGKNEIHWAIFSGVTMLPFTIRTTKRQCITDHIRDRKKIGLSRHEECKKVVVNEYKKEL